MSPEEAIEAVRDAFRDVLPPDELFIRGTCLCCECQEHNQTLASHDRDNITLRELGNPGSDPICFASDEAFSYYLPAMVRLAFEDPHYMEQLAFHLSLPDRLNRLTSGQAGAVLAALWSWADIHLQKLADQGETSGDIRHFDDAIRRLEAVASMTHS